MEISNAKSEMMRKRAIELYEGGLSLGQIAERTGYKYGSVAKLIGKHKKDVANDTQKYNNPKLSKP